MHNIEIRTGIGRIENWYSAFGKKRLKGTDNQLSSKLLFCQQEA